jgi:hypothetical protein
MQGNWTSISSVVEKPYTELLLDVLQYRRSIFATRRFLFPLGICRSCFTVITVTRPSNFSSGSHVGICTRGAQRSPRNTNPVDNAYGRL